MSLGTVHSSVPAAAQVLLDFVPAHDYFVGIDSDGCAFDAMEIKHKECFIPNTIRHWGLQPVSSLTRQTCEFVNLYSTSRGQNRWIALVRVFDLLRERPEVAARGVEVPAADALRGFLSSGYPLSGPGLAAYAAAHPDPELDRALAWTAGVDGTIGEMVTGVPPFPWVRDTLAAMRDRADLVVVSATPLEALEREWAEHGLAEYVDLIAGQEMGTKGEHLAYAAKGKYDDDRILLVGDAPGDRDTARAMGVRFYPINPGFEAESWQRLHDEALGRFLDGSYAGDYEQALVAQFDALLPDLPPWRAQPPTEPSPAGTGRAVVATTGGSHR